MWKQWLATQPPNARGRVGPTLFITGPGMLSLDFWIIGPVCRKKSDALLLKLRVERAPGPGAGRRRFLPQQWEFCIIIAFFYFPSVTDFPQHMLTNSAPHLILHRDNDEHNQIVTRATPCSRNPCTVHETRPPPRHGGPVLQLHSGAAVQGWDSVVRVRPDRRRLVLPPFPVWLPSITQIRKGSIFRAAFFCR